MSKLVILGRDGVINQEADDRVGAEQEWCAVPGSLQAVARLNHHGYRVVVATNQPDLARGRLTLDQMHKMHRRMLTHLAQYGGAVDAVFFCPHAADADCACRKPRPGLFVEIEKRLGIPMDEAVAIGDEADDVLAAQAAGARAMLVKTGKGQQQLQEGLVPAGVPVHDDLAQATADLLDAG